MNGELQLPEVIIQHIQSFLNQRQAARTSVLSKSWYSAWSSRPILDFNERDFKWKRNTGVSGSQIAEPFSVFVKRRFMKFVKGTVQRYHELNLKIEVFRLWICVIDSDSASLVNEFITRALKLGVSDFSLEISGCYSKYVLPEQVFEAKSLIKLSVVGCTIRQHIDGGVICSSLESLTLCRVSIWDDMIRDIMLGCPLLENLHLLECKGLLNVNASKLHNLEKFCVIKCRDCNLKCLWVDVPEYGKLSCLMLEQVKIDEFFFHDFSLKFPCLGDLSLHHCDGYNNIEISSRSLKYISLIHKYELKKVKFEHLTMMKATPESPSIPARIAGEDDDGDGSFVRHRGRHFLPLKAAIKLPAKSRLRDRNLSVVPGLGVAGHVMDEDGGVGSRCYYGQIRWSGS
ncbi:hypothetical protein BUALT_Bualt01G0151300 [Buddleja alternifolia]|uniref:F-box domain-containing protein n=1 Tax=Buddleja alternifolia TaxID=168488 RepID=A0AAV6YF29_9LAMI|nr:hypothetical protein BUALT_Bualt01G0151300 [Buddleja alternifolia]